jgi:glycosyltransferase involved in cell wall biosynthesis
MSVSLCMIVKNEERCISRCLNSVSSFVSEMVIVDTGSTDRTKEIIQDFSNKFPNIDVKILDFEWIDDFSAARNFSVSQATKDYILIVDADEYIRSSAVSKIKSLLDKIKNDKKQYFVNAKIINSNNVSVYTERTLLFPNHLNVKFSRPIHEFLDDSSFKIPNTKLIKAKFPVYHDGYDIRRVDMIEKTKRNLKLLGQAIDDNPNDTVSMYYFARDYYSIDPYKSVEFLQRVQKHLDGLWLKECKYYIDLYSSYLAKSEISK